MSTPSPARDRILDTASRLFYAEGIHTVGVDRIVTEAAVTRATFYRHFPSKEELILSHLQRWDDCLRAEVAEVLAATAGTAALRELFGRLGAMLAMPGFRGCPFINAAAEYPDPAHPVARSIAVHRVWLLTLLTDLLTAGGHPDPEGRAELLMLLRDGAMVGASLGDGAAVARRLVEGAEKVLTAG
ncbi:TetR/AcrR family transcriptional regulator [Kitasatospora sp. NPDC006697]|uniref:TetR/AcrR family transcriptional regulator n=1 Tax=Kitasatospora sp. NPDC006697 TaxID=3364020 RepID=UPI0036C2F82C